MCQIFRQLFILKKKALASDSIFKVKSKNVYVLRIVDIIGITRVLILINGKLISKNKLNQVLILVDTNKGKKNISQFKDFQLNNSNNLDNYWLAGFSDYDASFQVQIVKRSTRPKP